MLGFLRTVSDIIPVFNFSILVALLAMIVLRSRHWNVIRHDERLDASEKHIADLRYRTGALEQNQHLLGDEIQHSLVSLNQDITSRLEMLSRRLTRTDGFIHDLRTHGCGHPDCPLALAKEKQP